MSSNKSIYNLGDKLLLSEKSPNFIRLYSLYMSLALNRFKWNNLPNSVEQRHIEKALLEYGQAFIYDNKDYGIICLPCVHNGQLNIYGEPTAVNLIGFGKTINNIPVNEGVLIKANNINFPMIRHIYHYADLISLIDNTIRKNVDKLKTPYIVSTTKENEKSYRLLLNKIKNDEDDMFIDNSLSNGGRLGIEILNTNVPMYIPQLETLKHDLECELLTVLGINNTSANNDKKERLLVDEVNVNNGEILTYLDVEYVNRYNSCQEINNKFGLNISVNKNILLLSSELNHNDKEELDNE